MSTSTEPRVRMDMSEAEAAAIDNLLVNELAPVDPAVDRLKDQIWLVTMLTEQRRRVVIAERDKFTCRANRCIAVLDPILDEDYEGSGR